MQCCAKPVSFGKRPQPRLSKGNVLGFPGMVMRRWAGMLNGAVFGSDMVDFTIATTCWINTGQVVLATCIEFLRDLKGFTAAANRAFV